MGLKQYGSRPYISTARPRNHEHNVVNATVPNAIRKRYWWTDPAWQPGWAQFWLVFGLAILALGLSISAFSMALVIFLGAR